MSLRTKSDRLGVVDDIVSRISKFVNDHIVFVMIVPSLLVLFAIFLYPVLFLIRESFIMTVPGLDAKFAGIYNYQQMFTSPLFWEFFENTLIFSFGVLIVAITVGFTLALAINHVEHNYLSNAYATIILWAWAVPVAVVALIWRWILQGSTFGALNKLLLGIGIIQDPVAWLANPNMAMTWAILVDALMTKMPFAMIVFLAGLQSIPQRIYEAADIDGATTFQKFRAITLPYMRPYFGLVALVVWMFAFRIFATIFPLTGGGPGNATKVFSIYIYEQGILRLNTGHAAAVSVFLVGITFIMLLFYSRAILERVEE